MKILQFIFNLSSGGAEKFVVDLSNELSKDDEVYLCVIQNRDEKIDVNFFKDKISEKVNIINLGCSKGINLKTFVTFFKLIRRVKPNVVHFHLNTILYVYLPAFLFNKEIVFIHTLHSIPSETIGFKWQKIINKIFYKNNYIRPVVISKENKMSYFDFYGLNSVDLIENGVSPPVKTKEFELVKKKINELKSDSNDKVFIHIGRYDKAKNQELLINVFNRLLEENKKIVLIILGDYFNLEPGKRLKEMSKKGIFFLGVKKNVSDYLLNSNAFVLSSLWEGLPMSLLEAMSCGIIPVCTPAGGIPGVIKDESLGFVSKDFSEIELYRTITKCIENMDSFNREKLLYNFKTHYSMEKCSANYKSIY